MRLYWEFIKNTFQSELVYRTNTFFMLIGNIIGLLIQISIWRALLLGKPETGIVSFQQMVTYTILSTAISLFIGYDLLWIIEDKIRSGEIANDLIKPVDLRIMLLSQVVGGMGSTLFIELVPMLTFGILCFGIQLPTMENGVMFSIATFNGIIINSYICYICGLTGFWWNRVKQFFNLLRVSFRLFSGSFVPLWFFPKALADLAMLLPFRLIYYTPLAIYLGKIPPLEVRWQIINQLLWIAAFFLIERLMWKKAIRKLVIQGG